MEQKKDERVVGKGVAFERVRRITGYLSPSWDIG